MSARAPQAIYSLWDDIHKRIPRAVLSGIVGDVAHSFGYHLARRDLPGGDYSVQLHLDRLGASDCASALDVSLPPDLMKTCTANLLRAAKAHDPRLKALREFCGTLNGSQTYPWDLSTDTSEGVNTWDDSHLWHIHLSFYRAYADDYAALAPIADVFAGLEEDMPLTNDDVVKIWTHDLANGNPVAQAYQVLMEADRRIYDTEQRVTAVEANLQKLLDHFGIK